MSLDKSVFRFDKVVTSNGWIKTNDGVSQGQTEIQDFVYNNL